MGYYTAYTINYTIPEGKDRDKLSQELALKLSVINNDLYYAENCTIEDMIEEDVMKWYDHEEDMCKLSELFPDVLFTLEGNGEEQDDIWREYFYCGLFQYAPAIITFDKFDKNKLKKLSV